MIQKLHIGHDVFEYGCEMLDVSSMHRPDTAWKHVDAQGHEHRWYVDAVPATSYNPMDHYETPTLVWVKDGEEYWEDDDEPHEVGHYECAQCGERITPAYTADTWAQYMPGLRWHRINGTPVSPDEFTRRLEAKSQR